jgi:hypothetical protein
MFAKSLTIASVLSTALAGPLARMHTRSTLPDVTIKALPAGCASYPGYNADTKAAGPWSLTVPAAENPDLIGFGPTTYSLKSGDQGRPEMRWGFVRIAVVLFPWPTLTNTDPPQLNLGYRYGIARSVLQCTDDQLNVLADTSVDAAGKPGDTKWTPLVMSPYAYDANVLYLQAGDQPTLYEHYVGEVKQDGWFLGAYNTTTWAVKWYEAESTSYFYPYFSLRALPQGQGLDVNETRIFLEIQV